MSTPAGSSPRVSLLESRGAASKRRVESSRRGDRAAGVPWCSRVFVRGVHRTQGTSSGRDEMSLRRKRASRGDSRGEESRDEFGCEGVTTSCNHLPSFPGRSRDGPVRLHHLSEPRSTHRSVGETLADHPEPCTRCSPGYR